MSEQHLEHPASHDAVDQHRRNTLAVSELSDIEKRDHPLFAAHIDKRDKQVQLAARILTLGNTFDGINHPESLQRELEEGSIGDQELRDMAQYIGGKIVDGQSLTDISDVLSRARENVTRQFEKFYIKR